MSSKFIGKHIVSVDQFEKQDIAELFAVARRMEPFARRQQVTRVLEGAVLGNLFFEPSTRTRISFNTAFARLGGSACDTTGFQFSSMAKGESLYDTARVLSGYCDAIVMRHPVEGSLAEFSAATNVPVISGGDGAGEHPSQALLDLYTIFKEFNRDAADGLKIAMVGDLKFGRTVHSLAKLLSLYKNVEFHFVAPKELSMPTKIVEHCKAAGHTVRETESLYSSISEADVVYMTRVQQERFTSEQEAERYRGFFVINQTVYEKYCKPTAIVMHPLPRDSRAGAQEISIDMNANPNLAIFRQADNGIPVRMALFASVLGVADRIEEGARPVSWYVPKAYGVDNV